MVMVVNVPPVTIPPFTVTLSNVPFVIVPPFITSVVNVPPETLLVADMVTSFLNIPPIIDPSTVTGISISLLVVSVTPESTSKGVVSVKS